MITLTLQPKVMYFQVQVQLQVIHSLFEFMKKHNQKKFAITDQLIRLFFKDNELNEKEMHYYYVVTGNYKYIYTPWTQEDLQPDLVMTMKLPKEEYIDRSKFLSLSSYMSAPSAELQTAFVRAQKNIMSQMTKNKEQADQKNIQIRLQKAIVKCKKTEVKNLYFFNDQDEKQSFQVECVHQKEKILDTFTLQYNAIVYTLQKICGFRVRSFLLYDQDLKNQRIFLYLNLSPQNRLRVAAKYKIKKEIDYAQIDFFLNDPCGKDGRPLKLHSSYKDSAQVIKNHKQINRYFNIKDRFLQTNGVIQEQDYNFQEQNRFLLHNQQVKYALWYYKLNKEPSLTNYQKQYIYLYNNKKINKGCKILYHKFAQRRQFFQVAKILSEKYNFRSTDQPEIFQKFMIPSKYNKGAGYFQRLRGILLYKPQIVGPYGELDLFLKMQKIKLAYLVLKKTFKLNFLQKIGFDIFTFGSQFQKYGKGGGQNDGGGIDGENLAQKWPVYTIFTKLSTIRNYCGDIVGHQVSFKIYMFYFFLATAVPYTFLFILEQIFKSFIYLGSDFCKLAFISIFFRAYITLWSLFEQQFINEYQEEIPSKIFLNTYRGPYIRNLVTDEVNQYKKQRGFLSAIKNLACIVIILALLVACGSIFYGCRMLLLSIYDQYYKLKVSSISFPHFFAYLLFFILMDLLRYFATDHIIDFLVYIKNPPSDEDSRQQSHNFRFFYLLGIELIAPIFFYIIQPFKNTDCYAKNCNKQIQYYVYSRYLIKIGEVLLRFSKLLVAKYSMGLKKTLIDQKPPEAVSLQGRLSKLLMDSLQESDKNEHKPNSSFELVIVIGYALYSLLLPIVVVISLLSLFIQIFNLRTSLLESQRRPINQSQSVLRLSQQLNIIFFIGIITNSLMMIFSFQTIENNFPRIITTFLSTITIDLVFFLKIVCVIFLTLILMVLSAITTEITKWAASNWLLQRKKNKFKEYVMNQLSDKLKSQNIEERVPIKSIARTWNPLEMPHEVLQRVLDNYAFLFNNIFEQPQEASTFSQLAPKQ